MTMSEAAASVAGSGAVAAPCSAANAVIERADRLWTVSAKPARARWAAIGVPIRPSPMKPTRSLIDATSRRRVLVPDRRLEEDFLSAREVEGRARREAACVRRDPGGHRADVVGRAQAPERDGGGLACEARPPACHRAPAMRVNPVRAMSDIIVPGQIALTAMVGASSWAMTWVMPTTANFEAE